MNRDEPKAQTPAQCVNVVRRSDGVGVALRILCPPVATPLPEDMAALLAQLDAVPRYPRP